MTLQSLAGGTLYIVATPIGNLGDMVPRAIQILQEVDLIAAEDTRHSSRLLQHFQISTPLVAYHDYSDTAKVQWLFNKLAAGESIAVISDAGTPLISDPGYRLVSRVRQAGYTVTPIPGPCAAIAALSACGLPSNRFSFEGFPPAKHAARQTWLANLASDPRTLIFYESPHRVKESLADMVEAFGAEREAALAREITKTFETFLTGSLAQIVAQVEADANQCRGEIVLVVRGYEAIGEAELADEAMRTMAILLEELPLKQAAALAAKLTGEKKNKLYRWALALKEK